MARAYGDPPCWELVADVYTSVLAEPVERYKAASSSVRDLAAAFRLALHSSPHGFQQRAVPVDFAVVLMGRTKRVGVHHAGVFYGGKVLHALAGQAGQIVLHQDLLAIRDEYQVAEFWAKES